MPIVNIPGAGLVRFPDDMSDKDIGIAIRQDILPSVQKSGFGAGLSGGLESLKGAALAAKYGVTGSEADRKALLESQARAEEKYQGVGLEDVQEAFKERGVMAGLGRTWEAAKGTLGQSVPFMAAPVVGALAAPAVLPAAGIAGLSAGAIGFAAPSLAQYTGTGLARQVEEQEAAMQRGETPQELSLGKAALGAIPATVLDRFALGKTFKGTGLGKLFGEEGKDAVESVARKIVESGANPSKFKSILAGGGRGIAAEIPNEVGQQIIERAQAGLDLTSDEAIKEYKEAAFGATLLGGPFGGASGMGMRGAGMRTAAGWEQRAADETATYTKKEADRLKSMETTQTSILDTIKAANEREAARVGWQGDISEVGSAALDRSLNLLNNPEGVDTILGNMGEYFPGTPAAELKKLQIQLRTYKQRMTAQIKDDQKKGRESAFTANLPDLLGEYRVEPTSVQAPEIEAPRPEFELGQQMPAPVQGELDLQPTNAINTDFLKSYGLRANTAVSKALTGLDLNNPADVQSARTIITDALESERLSTKTQEKLDELARKESRLREQGELFTQETLDKLQSDRDAALAEEARTNRNKGLADLLADLEKENAAKEEASRVAREQADTEQRAALAQGVTEDITQVPFAGQLAPAVAPEVTEQGAASPSVPSEAGVQDTSGGVEPSVGVYDGNVGQPGAEDRGIGGGALESVGPNVEERVETTGAAGDTVVAAALDVNRILAGLRKEGLTREEARQQVAEATPEELTDLAKIYAPIQAAAKTTTAEQEADIAEAAQAEGEFGDISTKFSEGREGGAGVGADQVNRDLKKLFSMPARFDDLVTVVQSADELPNVAKQDLSQASNPNRVQAFVGSDGRIYMVADNIVPGEELGVFLHELGAHVGMEGLIGAANVRALTGQIMKWADMGNNTQESQIAQRALARAEQSSAEDKSDEVIAYFVEEAVKAGVNPTAVQELNSPLGRWFRKLWASIKVGLRKIGMGKLQNLTTQNIVDLAYGAANLELSGAWHGTAAEFRKFNHEYMGTGEGAQVYGWGSYLAQRPGIAHGYWKAETQKRASQPVVSYAGKNVEDLSLAEELAIKGILSLSKKQDLSLEDARQRMIEYLQSVEPMTDKMRQINADKLEAMRKLDVSKITETQPKEGNLMRVSFNANELELLDWDTNPNWYVMDKLQTGMPEALQKALEDEVGPPMDLMNGGELYSGLKMLEARSGMLAPMLDPKLVQRINDKYKNIKNDYNAEIKRAEEITSMYLDSLGVKGTRYLDAESRYTPQEREEYLKTHTLLRDTLREQLDDMKTMMDNAQKMGEDQAYQKAKRTYDHSVAKLNRLEKNIKELQDFKPTRNVVVFNDKNIVRAVSYKGAEKGKVKFSEATTPEELYQAAGGYTPTAAGTKLKNRLKATTESFSSVEKLVDKINNTRTRVFSSDTKFNARVQKALQSAGLNWKDLMLVASTSQALHRGGLAERFLEWGTLSYDNKTNRWESKEDDVNIVAMGKKIREIADDMKADPTAVKGWVGEAWVAKRLENINQEIVKLEKEIDEFTTPKTKAAREYQSSRTEKLELLQRVSELRTPEQLAAGLELYNRIGAGNMKALNDMKNTMRERVLKMLVDTQVMTKDKAETFLENAEWVPFYRVTAEDENIGGPAVLSKGLSEQMKEKKLKGATGADDTKQISGVDNLVKWLDWSVRRAVSNQQKHVMIDLFKENVSDEIHEGKGDKGYTISVLEDGREKFYHFDDPFIAEAFTGMLPVMVPGMKAWRATTETLRKSVTRFPLFPVAQIVQDTYDAMFTSGLKHPTKVITQVLSEMYKTYKGESAARKALLARGVLSRDYSAAAEQEAAEVLAGLKDQNWWEKVNYNLEKFSSTADHIVRQAVYAQAKAEGLSDLEATEKATELINFRRQGSATWVNWMRTMVPFFGAYLQVQNVALKTISGEGISPTERKAALATLAMTAAKVALFSTIYSMVMGDDDDYKGMDRRTRDRMILIPGTDVGISIRPNVFATPKIFAEHAYGYLTDNGTTDGTKFRAAAKAALIDSVLPSSYAVPQLIRPTLEVAMDHNIYLDKPIVGNLKNLEKYEQFSSSTSELAKLLGSSPLSPMSPVQWDHILRGYFSSVGTATMLATNDALAAAAGRPRPDKSWQDTINSIPNMGSFVTKEFGSGDKTDFYELAGEVEKVNNTVNRLKSQGRGEEIESYLTEEKQQLLSLKKPIANIQKQIAAIRKQRNAIMQSTEMTGAEKAEAIRELNEAEREVVKGRTKELREAAGF